MTPMDPRVKRLRRALADRCWLPLIAAQVGMPVEEARALLEQMARQGLAERYTSEMWGRT